MDRELLNLEQAMEFLCVSEKTLIKLLREEHIPARKIGREWRFSKEALINWLAAGDSLDYINQNDLFMVSKDVSGSSDSLITEIHEAISQLRADGNNIQSILEDLDKPIIISDKATLRISYKQQRDVEKLEFKIYWDLREDAKLDANRKTSLE